jgi:hypothetical protein
MIKNLLYHQQNAKHADFAIRLTEGLRALRIDISPVAVAKAFNEHYKYKSSIAKPHTVRKWLLGQSLPKSETFLLLANWLKIEPKELMSKPLEVLASNNKVSFEFDFTDQEVISKYLSMTVKQKITVRLLIDAITDKN